MTGKQLSLRLPGKASDFLKIGVAAAGRGDLSLVKAVLAVQPDWLHRSGSHGRTMLWEAAWRGQLEMVHHLCELGADPNACACHFTPLLVEISACCAAEVRQHDDVTTCLRGFGAAGSIYSAAYLGNLAEVQDFLASDPNLLNREKPQHDANVRATVLHYSVAGGHTRVVTYLLDKGANPAPYSYWIIRFAIHHKRADLLELLIQHGADLKLSPQPRTGILDKAISEVLARHGVKPNPNAAEGGWPPIVFQCRGDRGGDLSRVKQLISDGADVNVRNHKGQAALHCAAKAGFVTIVELLIRAGADIDATDNAGETPLVTALRSTIKDDTKLHAVAAVLARAGADINRTSKAGHSARSVASRKRNAKDWLASLGAT